MPVGAGAVSEWRPYRSTQRVEMRPYIEGEPLTFVITGLETLQTGGMIARLPERPDDEWYIGPRAFYEGFERVE